MVRRERIETIQVPWAEGSSRYTVEFEAEVIEWLQDASVAWIMEEAVRRGLARRGMEPCGG